MKRLTQSGDNAAMALWRSVLEAAGLEFEVRHETLAELMPSVPFAAELWVRDEDFAEATELLATRPGEQAVP